MNVHRATLIGILLAAMTVAWQKAPPISLTATADPPVARRGETLAITFTVTNTGSDPLEDVQLTVGIPEHAGFVGANVGAEGWATRRSGDRVIYRAQEPLPAGASARLGLWLTVLQERGGAIRLDDYSVRAKGLTAPVTGEPLTIWVEVTPTPHPSPTTTPTPRLATPTATGTVPPTPPTATLTPSPPPTSTPRPTPSATFIFPTPTPNLSPEQERLGSLAVLVFVGLAVVIVMASLAWLIRRRRVQ